MHPGRFQIVLLLAGVAGLGDAATASAQHATVGGRRGSSPSALQKEAKISADSAQKIAQAQVPNGTIRSRELERENGNVIYSFDIKIAGKSGVEEINVNAIDGTVVAHEHESAAAEARESHAEVRGKTSRPKAARDTSKQP